jgi:adenylate kinase
VRLLVLLGAPGSGKGTQAKLLAERLGLVHLSTGDILREEVRRGTQLGNQANQYMNTGELVPDALILDMIKTRLVSDSMDRGFIFDGFPRTVTQAEGLCRLADEVGAGIDRVINLAVGDDVIVRRLTARSTCGVCGAIYNDVSNPSGRAGFCDKDGAALVRRADDSEAVVRNRLSVYNQQTKPLEEYYSRKGLLLEVEGRGATDQVLTRILASLAASGTNDRAQV